MATKIRKDQIRIEEFIQAMAGVDWTSDVLTASSAAIADKIHDEISDVAGAMQYRGSWSMATTDTIKKGYVYVYAGSSNGSIGTGSGAITLEPGDMIIANRDSASISDQSHWTVVNVNITGAITESNLATQLYDKLSNGNPNSLIITNDTTNNKVKLTVNFPSISNGSAVDGKYICALSINPITGSIEVTRADIPKNGANCMVIDEAVNGDINGSNLTFTSAREPYSTKHCALYINGIRQHVNSDYTVTIDSSSHRLKFKIDSSSYIPRTGDIVTCDYMAKETID